MTTAFGEGWPDAPHRVLTSPAEAAAALPEETVGIHRSESGQGVPLPRWSVEPPSQWVTGKIQAMALYAGKDAGAVAEIAAAADVVRELITGAEALLGTGPSAA